MPGPLHPRATVLTVRSLSPADEDGVVGGEGYLYTYAAGQGGGPPTRIRQPAAPPAVEEEVGPWMMPMSQGRPPEEFAAAKQREAAESGGRRSGRPPPTLPAPAAVGAGTPHPACRPHHIITGVTASQYSHLVAQKVMPSEGACVEFEHHAAKTEHVRRPDSRVAAEALGRHEHCWM